MEQNEVERIIRENIVGIVALDYSDVSFMDEFIETAHSPHLLVNGVECHIERTRYVDAHWLPVNYVIVTRDNYDPTITVEGSSVDIRWTMKQDTPAVYAVKAEAVLGLVNHETKTPDA
jgi:hypothetical protein